MKKSKIHNEEANITRVLNPVGQGDPRMIKAVIDAQDEKGKINWKKVIKNLSKTENDNRSAHK